MYSSKEQIVYEEQLNNDQIEFKYKLIRNPRLLSLYKKKRNFLPLLNSLTSETFSKALALYLLDLNNDSLDMMFITTIRMLRKVIKKLSLSLWQSFQMKDNSTPFNKLYEIKMQQKIVRMNLRTSRICRKYLKVKK